MSLDVDKRCRHIGLKGRGLTDGGWETKAEMNDPRVKAGLSEDFAE